MRERSTSSRRRTAIVGVVAAATAIGSAAAGGTNASAVPETAAADSRPDRVERAIDQLDGLAEELMAKSDIPGMAVAVVYQGEQVYAKGFGVRREGSPATVNPNTVFQLASVSKSLAATVVAHEVTHKSVGWHTPVVRNLPGFRLADRYVSKHVTIGDMFSHRSGLPGLSGNLLEDIGYARGSILKRLRLQPLNPFRSTYAYSNYGLTAGAQSVAKAAGTDWATLSRRVLYRPLGMDSTSSRFADFVRRPNRARGHVEVDGRYVAKYLRDADPESPAGGASSNVNDISTWLEMLLANGTYEDTTITSPKALLPALTPQSVSSPPSDPSAHPGFYGYGFNVGVNQAGHTQFSHSGAFYLGTGTNYVAIPDLDLAIVTLTNATPTGVAETLNAEFADLAQFGSIQRPWWKLYSAALGAESDPVGSLVGHHPPAHPAPAQRLADYTGTYNSPYVGPMDVEKASGRLRIRLGPDSMTFVLRHWDGNRFVYTPRGENAPLGSISKVTFQHFRRGRPAQVTVEWFNKDENGSTNGLGVFHRRTGRP
ncbi:serine hydrolase [Solicola gregarius]|uniref:Serine hydrolase n=1 Tax=Solicola gregarius TaxID=2908642 RepID=A0AA46YKJ9_9ACTN|nr:serine hydrolase [Solicola gregarius]UYM05850.1 serine hydrolase [Solicola gregarius]